jgi:hypothetical protein
MRQARIASITGKSAKPTAPPKLRGLPRIGFADTNVKHAQQTSNFGNAPPAADDTRAFSQMRADAWRDHARCS